MTTKELLDNYYKGLAQKQGWDEFIADDFKFVGGDMTKTDPIVGKQAYIGIIDRFGNLFSTMRVKQMIIEKKSSCVIANYDYVFPNGNAINGNVDEIWKANNGKLDS